MTAPSPATLGAIIVLLGCGMLVSGLDANGDEALWVYLLGSVTTIGGLIYFIRQVWR
jgi:hypothetical protein